MKKFQVNETTKVKIFDCYPEYLEERMNEWFVKNYGVQVIDISENIDRQHDNAFVIVYYF